MMIAKLDTSTDPQVGFRPPGQLDTASALLRYSGAFGRRQAAQLARRTGFGPTPAEVDRLAALGVDGAVDSLLHPSSPDLDFPAYPDADKLFDPKVRNPATKMWWLDRMLRTTHPLTEKMTLFWHGHFATSMQKVPTNYMAGQINLFRSQALGNFRSLLLSVSKDPAMLIWLDNRYNVAAHPNENYAREIMELFALGLGNYSEADVKAAARAFSGWSLDKDGHFISRDAQHDPGMKTFLGRTGPWNGEDIVDIIVQQPIHQRFICRELLEFFVYSDPEPQLIDALAQVYALSGYDLAKTVGTIIRSNVFYSTRAYRALPKSPVEFGIGLMRYMDVRQVPADVPYWLARMGQDVLMPPSVKGWDGGPTWISTATLLARFNFANRIVKASPPKPAPAAAAMSGTTMVATAATAPAASASPKPAPAPPPSPDLFAAYVPDTIVAQAGGMDVHRVLETIVGGALQDDLTSDVRSTLLDYLNATSATLPVPFGPENYQERIRGVLALVLNLPSNQLN
jgi:hypothetical protein